MSPRFSSALAWLTLATWLSAGVAMAQDARTGDTASETTAPEDESAAPGDPRALFESGSAALEAGDFDAAVRDLSRSLELAERPGTAANLAVALREVGRPAASVAMFDRLLRGELGELSDELAAALRGERDTSFGRAAVLELRGAAETRLSVRIDDDPPVEIPPGARLDRVVEPGPHRVVAEAPEREPLRLQVELRAGERESVELALPSPVRQASLEVIATEPTHAVEIVGVGSGDGRLREDVDPGEYIVRVRGPEGTAERRVSLAAGDRRRVTLDAPTGGDVVESPWFWIIGGVLLLGGAAAVTAVVLTNPQREVTSPDLDNTFGVIRALRAAF